MKRSLLLFCTLCLIIITLLACNHDAGLPAEASPDTTPAETLPPVTSDTDNTTSADTTADTTPAETTEEAIKLTFPEVLADEIYDQEKLYEEGAACTEAFYPGCEIVRYTFLRSIKTGYSAYVLFEVADADGEHKVLVYDGTANDIANDIAMACEGGPVSSLTPYHHLEAYPDEYPAVSERISAADSDEVYNFYYPPLSFACGILNSDGTVDIYRLNGYDGTYFTITTFEAP